MTDKLSFSDSTISEKILFTCFLLTISLGYLMAISYLYVTHTGLDGKTGITVQDVAISYYGNRTGTKLEAMLRGPMATYSTRADTEKLVQWIRNGATESEYNSIAHPILEQKCFACHSGQVAKNMSIPDYSTFAGIGTVTQMNRGVSIMTLIKLSHIHLFGIGMLLLVLGFIFRLTVLNRWFKWTLLVTPFAAIWADVLAWFLTRMDPLYAYVVVIGGGLMGAAICLQIAISLYQIWFLRKPIDARG